LINSSSRGKLDKMMEGHGNKHNLAEEEAIITAIPKDKAEDLLEVIGNGMDKDREVYRNPHTYDVQKIAFNVEPYIIVNVTWTLC
jgi:hypothetical protein